jgi:hypothetical protein
MIGLSNKGAESLLFTMIINRNHKFIYIAIPRTASACIKMCLDAKKNIDQPPNIYHASISDVLEANSEELEKYIHEPNRRVSVCFANPDKHNHTVYGDKENEPIDNYYKFSFVRNPWDRFVSAYFEFKDLEIHPWASEVAKFKSFDDFLFEFPRLEIRNDVHFAPQINFVSTKSDSFDDNGPVIIADNCNDQKTQRSSSVLMNYIGKYENLQNDFEKICQEIGMKSFLLAERVQLRNNGLIPRQMANTYRLPHYSQHYKTPAHENVVADFYKEDIQLFGYKFEKKSKTQTKTAKASTWAFDARERGRRGRVKKKQVGLLIAGKTNSDSLSNLHLYEDFSDVVISAWKDDEGTDWNEVDKQPNTTIVLNKPIHQKVAAYLAKKCDPSRTFYYQTAINFYGLQQVATEYVIKTRSDEYFSDFSKMIQTFGETGKLISGNAFWRPEHPGNNGFFHIGDHVFICETEVALSAYEMMLKSFENHQIPIVSLNERNGTRFYEWAPTLAEAALALHYLEAKGFDMKDVEANQHRYLVENFDVININELGEYQISNAHAGKKWRNNFPSLPPKDKGNPKSLAYLPSCHVEIILDSLEQVVQGEPSDNGIIMPAHQDNNDIAEYIKKNFQVEIKE